MDLSLTDASGTVRSIASGNLVIPRSGLWTADLLLSDDDALPAVGTRLNFLAYDAVRSGTVVEAGEEYLQLRIRLVGGAGKLPSLINKQSYVSYGLDAIAGDTLTEAGETPGDLSGLSLIPRYWFRSAGPCASALRHIYAKQRSDGGEIRTYADSEGKICVVPWISKTYPSLNSRYTDLAIWPQDKEAYIAPDLTTSIEPMQVARLFDRDVTIVRTMYELNPDELRCRVWYDEP